VSRRVVALLLCALLVSGRPVRAEDVFYRSWRWLKETSAARGAGQGGAMTAVPDDASGAESNPAALTTLAKSELVGNVLGQRSGRTAAGDALQARTGLGFAGLGGRLSSRWAVGAYVVEPQGVRIESGGGEERAGSTDTGQLEGTLTETGASAAFRPTSRLHVGVRVARSRLSLDGSYRLQSDRDAPLLEVETRGAATSVTAGVGVLYEATSRLVLGLARLGGARFQIPRTVLLNGRQEPALSAEGTSEIRQPSIVSGGLSLLANTRVRLTGQLDYVRYGEIQTPFPSSSGGAGPPRLAVFAWEPRAGVEVSLPFSSFSVQLRAGISGRSAPLASGQELNFGASPTAAPVPQPSPVPSPAPIPETRTALQQITAVLPPTPPEGDLGRTRASAGASLVTAKGVRFDFAVRFGGEGTTVLAGTAVRF
jgi:hypothetical protein